MSLGMKMALYGIFGWRALYVKPGDRYYLCLQGDFEEEIYIRGVTQGGDAAEFDRADSADSEAYGWGSCSA